MFQSKSESNRIINDPVPKNASKFPIHQTYLTSDAERTGTGGYKFKAPEVWSSARSGKKSIAIRSIAWKPKPINLVFGISVEISNSLTDSTFVYRRLLATNISLYDILDDIKNKFEEWATDTNYHMELRYVFSQDSSLQFACWDTNDKTINYKLRFHLNDVPTQPSTGLNRLLNQPLDYFPESSFYPKFDNVWDRTTALNFHASFVPFDNYQNIGTIFDKWNNPIVFQDPNTSPLFNIWITTDLKTPIPILYEDFIFRFTFIISSNDFYNS
ncbi:hypothetical protein IKO50_05830 [bacterium]|nr:hypothetical protein [bacterium]